MSNPKKLKPTRWALIFVLVVIGSICIISVFAVLDSLLTGKAKLDAYGYTWLIFAVFNLVLFLLRKDLISLSFLLINVTIAGSYLTDYKGILIITPLVFLYLFYFYLLFVNHKLNSNYRQLLELAANPVKKIDDGFTSRPMVTGKLTFEDDEVRAFSRFLKKHFIAFPYFENEAVIFTIKDHRRFWFGRPNELKDSYVAFNFDGNIAVNISRKDYLKYKQEYSFNELCGSLGNLFKNFFELYRQGQPQRIQEMLAMEG